MEDGGNAESVLVQSWLSALHSTPFFCVKPQSRGMVLPIYSSLFLSYSILETHSSVSQIKSSQVNNENSPLHSRVR